MEITASINCPLELTASPWIAQHCHRINLNGNGYIHMSPWIPLPLLTPSWGPLSDLTKRKEVLTLASRRISADFRTLSTDIPATNIMLWGCFVFFHGRLRDRLLDNARLNYGRSIVNRTRSLSATFSAKSIART